MTPTSSQTMPPASDESTESLLRSILDAKHNDATEITVSPAPETSIMILLKAFVCVKFSFVFMD